MKKLTTLAMSLCVMALPIAQGCSTNLQRRYVQSMEDTRIAVEADVTAGLYKPDALARKTLDGWERNNADAKAVMVAEGKWGSE